MLAQGQTYIRKELHQQFGGQQQGGISTPKNQPFIMLFTGEQGGEYGYQDGWTSEGVFNYTGEDQKGYVNFVRNLHHF